MAQLQSGHYPEHILELDNDAWSDVIAPNKSKRYSTDFIPAIQWTRDYRDYVKPGESINKQRDIYFEPGAISRGMGGWNMPSVKERNFDWNKYKQAIIAGETPSYAAFEARPKVRLDWDNIVYRNGQYTPKPRLDTPKMAFGAVSRGMSPGGEAARVRREQTANEIRRWRNAVDNVRVVKNYGLSMTDDEIRELDRLVAKNSLKGSSHLPGIAAWSKLENPEILRIRQQALDKIKGSWFYDYLLNKE